ncbi:hypothetical protein LTR94_024986 [Friedmanniomyces endolithicus]|nr:hypothetical protein LTR94_024986 [Friedmanniomyces endolithicus]
MARGTVKFFNPAKGFGFIAPMDGGSDVFVHISAVQQAGLAGIDEGDELEYELEQDRRSGRTSAVGLTVISSAPRSAPRSPSPRFDRAPRGGAEGFSREPAGQGDGFGFGFIAPNGGGDDVFVHASALERAGLAGLSDGQAVSFDLEADRRTGKTSATNLRLL